jgi:hypothetical protein
MTCDLKDIDMATATARLGVATRATALESTNGSGGDKLEKTDDRIEAQISARTDAAIARHALIAHAAYDLAQQRGFTPGDDLQDWFAAEREVDAQLDPDL